VTEAINSAANTLVWRAAKTDIIQVRLCITKADRTACKDTQTTQGGAAHHSRGDERFLCAVWLILL
jgi:hypothetical protein